MTLNGTIMILLPYMQANDEKQAALTKTTVDTLTGPPSASRIAVGLRTGNKDKLSPPSKN